MASEPRPPLKVDLRLHSTRAGLPGGDDKGGRGFAIRALWFFVNALVMENSLLVANGFKARVLRLFGAQIGEGVIFKPSVTVKYPWFLTIGDHCWIGERVWLDCTSPLTIGSHVVISQGCFLCCGTHDWEDPGMGSVIAPIVVEDGVWIAAFSCIAGGVTIGQESMIAMGSVVFSDVQQRSTYRGNPAQRIGRRRIRDYAGPRRPAAARRPATPTESR